MSSIFKKIILIFPLFLLTSHSSVQSASEIDCTMNFTLESWSFIYKKGDGKGVIKCDNGKTYPIKIETHGAGLTLGKSKLKGIGHFSKVTDVNEVFGNFATAQAHAGIHESGRAQVLTKGDVSLSLTATGKGFNAGVSFGNFKISRL